MNKLICRTVLAMCLVFTGHIGAVQAEELKFDKKGPAEVKLGSDVATLKLPGGFGFVDQARTKVMIEKGGGTARGVLGYVSGTAKGQDYGIVLSFEDTGYVEDTDADKLNADDLLKSMKEGTEAQNEERKKRGLSALHVVGWDEPPHYDKAKHIVIWSIKGQREGQKDELVNYNTRVLGRKGVMEVNLICDQKDLQKYKPEVAKILASLTYNTGQKYEEHQAGDKVSPGGIAALVVGGVILKKAGVLAFLLGLFKPLLLLGKKAIVLVIAGIVGLFRLITGRKSSPEG